MRVKFVLIFLTASLLLLGCISDPTGPSKAFYTVRLGEAESESPPRVQRFGPGEKPAIYLRGYGGETVTIQVKEIDTGEAIWTHTEYIPANQSQWFYPPSPPGSYIVYLKLHGSVIAKSRFSMQT